MKTVKNYLNETVELNDSEVAVLNEIQAVADHYGEDGGFTFDEINEKVLNMTVNQIKGYISSLKKKGILDIWGPDSYFDGGIINWTYKQVW